MLQQLLLVTLGLVIVVLPVDSRQKNKCIDKDEDKSIPVLYKTCHRFEALNETTWPEVLQKSTKCRPGYYAQCHPCPLGYSKKSKRNKPCDLCGSGSGTPDEGAEWCTQLCKAGSRLLEDGKKKTRLCKPCEIGFYQPYPNVDYNCVQCPNNMTTAKPGSKSIKDCFLNCPPGQQPNNDSTECVLCPEGTYKSDSGPNMCQTCSKNRTTAEDGAIDSNQCIKPCEPGREYNKTSGLCDIKCERGTFKGEHSSRSKCRPCPPNFTPNARKAATSCIPQCGPGYKINSNRNNCTACEFGFFKTETGNFDCHSCPGSQMTLAKAAKSSGECQDFHDCVKPLSQKLELLFDELQGLFAESEIFIDAMVDICRYGPNNNLAVLLEEVVNSFQTCGVLGQINLSDVQVGGKMYTKEHYLEIFRTAARYGGMCKFVHCLSDAIPEINLSKTLIREYTPCPLTDSRCFCSDAYRGSAIAFHHYLQLCPAVKFHPAFLEVNIGGSEMIDALHAAPSVKSFCALSNGCVGIDCGHGTCSCSVSGGYQCRCRFGYTGEYCQTAQVPTEETEPDSIDENDAPASTTSSCPDPPEQPKCPTCESCHECPEPPEAPTCPTATPCPLCPELTEPSKSPTSPPCPECPIPVCPTNTPCPDCPDCPVPQCPTSEPCPEIPEPTKYPTTSSCPECPIPVCPPIAPCPDCPIPKCPTSEPCPDCQTPTCPTTEPCPDCPTTPEPSICPTSAPCPMCPKPPPCPDCPTLAMPTCTSCPECPTCPTSAPCPSCPEPPTPPVCPTSTSCPACPTLSSSPSIPTSTVCPVCPEHTTAAPLTCAPCPDCPTTPEPTPCPTTTHCPACPTTPEPIQCPTCPSCPTCPTTTEPPTCPTCPTTTEAQPCPTCQSCPTCPTTTEPPPCPTCMTCPAPTPCPTVAGNQRSCLELLRDGNSQSGIYEIFVQSLGKTVEVYCDQETDGGGWIVFQRRQDGSVDFYRDWNAYKGGFGQLSREFWLGLDVIHHLTTSMSHDLRIDLQSFDYEKRFAAYHTIKVGAEGSNYNLTADGYTGNAGDSFGEGSGEHNGQPFSTKDADNDAYHDNCAQLFKGGWWYKSCHYSNLNGQYLSGNHDSYADGINWYHWRGYHYSLKFTEMKIREWHDWTGTRKPKSCLELLKQGHTRSGMYQIYVETMGRNVDVYCDQDTDGGGWIVFQRRQDGSIDFYRGWNSYQYGFGQLEGEFWLGLEILHHITTLESCDLRIDFKSFDYESRLATYSKFSVGAESTNYVLTADGYRGTAGDAFGTISGEHNGQPFSTKDADNDAYGDNCAQLFKGGWWYKSCHYSNINGQYLSGNHDSYADGINWYHWRGYHYSLKFTEMKIREQNDWAGTRNPSSCLEWLHQGKNQSGIYQIYVASMGRNIEVYCDQTTDGGGWIVFQRRKDGSIDFYRGWNSYQFGFGHQEGELWLGLETLHQLTNTKVSELRIELQDTANDRRYAKYSTFAIGSDSSKYALTADGYTGDAGDSFGEGSGEHNGQPFSTKDADNDAYNDNCAQLFKGGWWYKSCHYSNLNGQYLNGDHASYADGINWYHWKGYHNSLTFTEMKLREKGDK